MVRAVAALLQRLATVAFRRRRTFVTTRLRVIVALAGSYAGFGSKIDIDFTIPGSSTQNARDELQ